MSLRISSRLLRNTSTHLKFNATARLSQLQSHTRKFAMASSIPKTMKGVIISKNGGTEVLEYKTDLPVPVPKAGEILVKNEFVGVNFIDTFVLPPKN